ncbi:MAG: hydroxymethylbilane synthase [Bacteroidota bacterium]
MNRPIKIGTRDSELATWQARTVAGQLEKLGHDTELIFVKSEGDLDLTTPLTEMGGKGVFTKALDDALLSDRIDIAVHSFKDLPTDQPLPLVVAAVLEREDPRDVLVAADGTDFLDQNDFEAVIASGSNRRRSQWLNRHPSHRMTDIRGNVNTRLRKLEENDWQGAIFAAAGLKRINLDHHISEYLEWMVPAPAQGAMAVMIREDDAKMMEVLKPLNHDHTALCTKIERDFLHEMEAGCSAPVGGYARVGNDEVIFDGVALSLDGSTRYDVKLQVPIDAAEELGVQAARNLFEQGAEELIEEIKAGSK